MSTGTYRSYEGDSVSLEKDSPFLLDHLSRYWWASERVKGLDVLDCACGSGYGSSILSKKAKSVTGIDLNPASLSAAKSRFHASNLNFVAQDVLKLGMSGDPSSRFDVVVAFEVIEHIPPETTSTFLKGISKVLRPGGALLLSTPNHEVVLKSGVAIPEFHINNFRAKELREVLQSHFSDVMMLGQYRKRSPLGEVAFLLDRSNWRHLLRPKHPPSTEKPDPTESPSQIQFDEPPPELKNYRFSPWHWRQAGLTVAICRGSPFR